MKFHTRKKKNIDLQFAMIVTFSHSYPCEVSTLNCSIQKTERTETTNLNYTGI